MAEQQTATGEGDPLAEHLDDVQVPTEAVARSLSAAYWWVDDCQWASVQPALPDDLVALLATPIVVGVTPVASKG